MVITERYLDRSTKSLNEYLSEIAKIPLLGLDEEVECAKLVREGDKQAKDKLVNANLRFVISVAKQFQGRNVAINDLINEGNIGLIKAAGKFDETRGFKFISYAVHYIRCHIINCVNKYDTIYVAPLSGKAKLNLFRAEVSILEVKLERVPEFSDVYVYFRENDIYKDMSKNEMKKLHMLMCTTSLSIDKPLGESDEITTSETLEGESFGDFMSEIDDAHNNLFLNRIVNGLRTKEKVVINHLFGLNNCEKLNTMDLSVKLGITRQRVAQIKNSGIKELKTMVETSDLF